MQIFCSGNPATSSTGVTSLDLEIMAVRTMLPPELTKWNLQIGPCWSHAPLAVVHAHRDPADQLLLCVTHQTRMDKHHRIHRGRQFWSDPKPRSSHIRKSPTTNLLAHFYKRFDFDRHCIYILIPLWILFFSFRFRCFSDIRYAVSVLAGMTKGGRAIEGDSVCPTPTVAFGKPRARLHATPIRIIN